MTFLDYINHKIILAQGSQGLILDPNNPPAGFFARPGGVGGNNFEAILLYIVTGILIPLAGLVAILFLIFGGYIYMTSGSNEEMTKRGKRVITNAIIGLVIIVLSYVILALVQNTISGTV